ncbi:hypothetical protein [Crocosphaera sp.]|uniref:hypothetical protein n=1 Tax=Crocosphaera sp. TaxID=2729996 RepID=UPI00260B17C7|nr:hypothetical protein [Crocosphaera sp.]MDJ0578690.1 hypothetical protein [Crocosphaera sp.]
MNYRKLLVNLTIGTLVALPIVLGTPEVAKANRRTLIIHNHTEANITDLYVSPEWSRYWGSDLLSYTLKPGDSIPIDITFQEGNCLYDILAKDINGNEVPPGGFGELNICKNDRFALTDTTMRVVLWP